MNAGSSPALCHRDHCRVRGPGGKTQHFSRSWPTLVTRQEEVGEASGRMGGTHKTLRQFNIKHERYRERRVVIDNQC